MSPPTPAGFVRPGRRIRTADVVLGVVVALFATVGTSETGPRPDGLGYLFLAVMGLTLIGHRAYPLPVFVTTFALQVLYLLSGGPESFDWLAPTVALASLTRARGWRWTLPIALVMLTLSLAGEVPRRGIGAFDVEAVLVLTGLGTATAVGEWLRTRDAYVASLEERARLLELRQQDEVRRRLDEERIRIAREVHDTVAHALAGINVQAGVAEHVSAEQPERLPEVVRSIRVASAQALDQLRGALSMLRSDDGENAPAISIGLDGIDELVQVARRAGIDVSVRIDVGDDGLPEAAAHGVFRIVQEAVTNTLRHADAAHLTIQVEGRGDDVEVLVADDGLGGTFEPGHGLTGMRERAAALGGTLRAGPRPAGGFEVHATLPWQKEGR